MATQVGIGPRERVHLDRCLGLAEIGPRKQRKAQVNGCQVKGIQWLCKLYRNRIALILPLRHAGQNMAEVLKDAPIPTFVGIGESRPGDVTTKTDVVKLLLLRVQAGFDIPQALTADHLSVCQTKELIVR